MQPVTTPHPGTREYVNQTLRLADLTVTEDLLENLRFENCIIIGPAVVALVGNISMVHCGFDAPDANALLWRVATDRDVVIGAVAAVDVEFYSCRFQRVGFAVRDDQYDDVTANLGALES